MNVTAKRLAIALSLLTVTASACTSVQSKTPQLIQIHGSTTVFPLTEVIAKTLQER